MFDEWEKTKESSTKILNKKIKKNGHSLWSTQKIKSDDKNDTLRDHDIRSRKFIIKKQGEYIEKINPKHTLSVKSEQRQECRFENLFIFYEILSSIMEFTSEPELSLMYLNKTCYKRTILFMYTYLFHSKTPIVFKKGILRPLVVYNDSSIPKYTTDHELVLVNDNGAFVLYRTKNLEGLNMIQIFMRFLSMCQTVILENPDFSEPIEFKCDTDMSKFIDLIILEIDREIKMDRKYKENEIDIQKRVIYRSTSSECNNIFINGKCNSNNRHVTDILYRCVSQNISFENFVFDTDNINYYYLVSNCLSLAFNNCKKISGIIPPKKYTPQIKIEQRLYKILRKINMLDNVSISLLLKSILIGSETTKNKILKIEHISDDDKKIIELLYNDIATLHINNSTPQIKSQTFMLDCVDNISKNKKYVRMVSKHFNKFLIKTKSEYIHHLTNIWCCICNTINMNNGFAAFKNLRSLIIKDCPIKNIHVVQILSECSSIEKIKLDGCKGLSSIIFDPLKYETFGKKSNTSMSNVTNIFGISLKANDINRNGCENITKLSVFNIPDFFNDIDLFLPHNLKTLHVNSSNFITNKILEVVSSSKINKLSFEWCKFAAPSRWKCDLNVKNIKILGLPNNSINTLSVLMKARKVTSLTISSSIFINSIIGTIYGNKNPIDLYMSIDRDTHTYQEHINKLEALEDEQSDFLNPNKNGKTKEEIINQIENIKKEISKISDGIKIKKSKFLYPELKTLTVLGKLTESSYSESLSICKFRKIKFINKLDDH